MGRVDAMIQRESGYEEKNSYKRMGLLDLMIEKQRGDEPKKEEKNKSVNHMQPDVDDDDEVTEMYKDYDLYLAAETGNFHAFKTILDRLSAADAPTSIDILCRLSPIGNTFLHVAARCGNKDILTFISAMKPSLVLAKNFNGDTALHLAAKAGDESMVKALVQTHHDLPLPDNADHENNLLVFKNDRGNTALHEALLSAHYSIAEYLIQRDPQISYHRNNQGQSVLYLAAKSGFAGCVSLILRLCTDEERLIKLFKEKSPIRAAIKRKHRDVLEAIFDANPRFIQLRDGKGRTPLHIAASLGYLEEVRYLLKKHPLNATQKDKTGSFPIHLASIKGHVDVIELLFHCYILDPSELLDRDGCNILHVAAKSGRLKVCRFILNNPSMEHLINMKDKSGNTPLHCATSYWHPRMVNALTWDKRVDIKAVNNNRMSALDAAEHVMPCNPQFRERLTWAVLKAAGTPRYLPRNKHVARDARNFNTDNYKDRVNTLLLVATLIATVTFAAGFTMPGGNNEKDPSNMVREKGFQVFVLCDIIAMYSSIIVVVALIWAQLGDLTLILNAMTLALPLLGISLTMMSVAFTAGVLIVVSKLRWLSTTILVMAISFLLILLLLFLPLCSSHTSTNRILRYLSYYPLCFCMLLSTTV